MYLATPAIILSLITLSYSIPVPSSPFEDISSECRKPIMRYTGCVVSKGTKVIGAADISSAFDEAETMRRSIPTCQKGMSDDCLGEAVFIGLDRIKVMGKYFLDNSYSLIDKTLTVTDSTMKAADKGLGALENVTKTVSSVVSIAG